MAAEGRQRCLVVVVWALLVAMALVPPTASVQWLRVVRHVRATLRVLNTIKNSLTVDLSSGQGDISSPDGLPVHVSAILHNRERSSSTSSSSSSLSPLLSSSSLSAADAMLLASSGVEVVPSRSAAAAGAAADGDDSTLLWVHQVGKRVVRKVPDTALLGVLVLVAAELLRRGVKANRDTMPPLLRDFAETTITELDTKLEQLSSLEWQVDPFFQAELENLQTQPLEVIDKFIVTQILPSVDKEFAPFLLKYMTGDTERVKTVTRNVKDLIELGVELLKIERVASLQKTKSSIIEQVDEISHNIEEVIIDWNSKITSFTGKISGYMNTGSVKSLLAEALLLPPPARQAGSSQSNTAAAVDSEKKEVAPKVKKTLMWNKSQPLKFYTVIEEDSVPAGKTDSTAAIRDQRGGAAEGELPALDDPSWVSLSAPKPPAKTTKS